MKNYTLTIRQRGLFLGLVALVLVLATPVHAQMSAASGQAPYSMALQIAQEGWPTTLPVATNLTTIDYDQLTKKQWKQLRRELINVLRTGDDKAWEQATLNVLFLSTYYRDRVNFERASTPLLEAYIFDRNEQRRILALAAMYAIGDHDTMAHLAQRVRLEASPRVRRITTAAVVDYFAPATPVKMGPARQIGSSL